MPPTNEARRDRLADAAIEVLARAGARGLTHRAVDAEAAEPPGTTSRYFRTRDALLGAVADRIRALHFADLAAAPAGPVDPAAIGEHLAAMVHAALTRNRGRHLAAFELFLEAARRPELAVALTEVRTAQLQLFRDIHRAAGIELSSAGATGLVATINGIILLAMTTPAAIGLRSAEDVRPLIRAAVADAQRSIMDDRGLGDPN